tara:strand:- start:244 stop:483 length:240 start_codon:yes stop_codon:yes gene_type:complete
MDTRKDTMRKALIKHAEGQIAKHQVNVEIYMQNAVGVGEHTDILESVEKELNAIGKYAEQIEVLEKYFPAGDAVVNLNG